MIPIEINLKLLREKQIGTQSDLGIIIGVGKSEVSQWENRKRFPSRKSLLKLEELFDEPHSYLFAEAKRG